MREDRDFDDFSDDDDLACMLKEATLSKDDKESLKSSCEIKKFSTKTELPAPKESTVTEVVSGIENAKIDFAQTRNTMLESMKIGKRALDSLLEISESSQHPYSFEVLAKLIDTIGTASEKMINAYAKMQELEINQKALESEAEPDAPQTQNNIIFNGTTGDLLNFLDKQSKK